MKRGDRSGIKIEIKKNNLKRESSKIKQSKREKEGGIISQIERKKKMENMAENSHRYNSQSNPEEYGT